MVHGFAVCIWYSVAESRSVLLVGCAEMEWFRNLEMAMVLVQNAEIDAALVGSGN